MLKQTKTTGCHLATDVCQRVPFLMSRTCYMFHLFFTKPSVSHE